MAPSDRYLAEMKSRDRGRWYYIVVPYRDSKQGPFATMGNKVGCSGAVQDP